MAYVDRQWEVERDVVAVRGRLDYPRREAAFPYIAALEALDRLGRDAAKCGRLREQLDAARERGAEAWAVAAEVRSGDYLAVTRGEGTMTAVHIPITEWQALCAALGVEGEQDNT